jgi:tetratricopeptide (TPR) repeat protein
MEQEVAKDVPIDKKPEGSKLAEALTTGQEKEVLQKLLDEALVFYRDGKYQEAIAKWEEVLVMYPDNLEAKFNIEIAKEKVKSLPVK